MKSKFVILLVATVWAMLVAIAANAFIFFIGIMAHMGIETFVLPETGKPVSLWIIVISTLGACIAALLNYIPVWYFSRIHAVRIFRLTSLIVLLFSFLGPASLPNAPVPVIILLDLMHIVTAAAINWAFTFWAHNKYHAVQVS